MAVAVAIIAIDVFTVEDQCRDQERASSRMAAAAMAFFIGLCAKASKYIV